MGAFLDKPKTDKAVSNGDGHNLKWGVSAMQGWRMEMEDAHSCDTALTKLEKWSWFAVYDGHAGPKVSEYCSQNLLGHIMNGVKSYDDEEMVSQKIHDRFLEFDEKMMNQSPWSDGKDRGGTTAICCMVSPKKLIWANCGDSRGLLCRDGKLEYYTADHKPVNERERQRIERAGGTVMMQRVNGSLAVSRALGDFDYKRVADMKAIEQLVSPEPEMHVMERSEKDQFLLLACDGIFDVMTNDEIVMYVLHHLELEKDLSKVCSDLIDTCLNKNSRDNMSVILVTFPSAPAVSDKAIEEDKIQKKELRNVIEQKLDVLTKEAHDPMEMEENYVVQRLNSELSVQYSEIYSERGFISELIQKKKIEKFGKDANNSFGLETSQAHFQEPFPVDPTVSQDPYSDDPMQPLPLNPTTSPEENPMDTDEQTPEVPKGETASPSNTDVPSTPEQDPVQT